MNQISPVDIDDISFTPGRCPSPVTCDFNTDMCGWVRDLSLDWIWDHGIGRLENAKVIPTRSYAPMDRSTPSSGMFMYTDFSSMKTTVKKTMTMHSEFVTPSTASCLTFFYMPFSFGDSKVQFRVVLIDTTGKLNLSWWFQWILKIFEYN